ncbi:hypothetical protein SIN01_17610 [Sporolactobacillus inulinus]|nr:hypothetical protein SIN01_17610 [Sporolactobacillus inulinus]
MNQKGMILMPVNPSDPSFTLFGDSTRTVTEQRDAKNFIFQLFGSQLSTINTGFFNARMTRGIIIQPHWHTNASELVFVICGTVITSVFNPFTQKVMSYRLNPGQVCVLPKGWFHWILALTDDVHLLTIFDQPTPDVVFGSDFLRVIPAEVMNRAYCVDPAAYAQAVAPIQQSTILGPPVGCTNQQQPNETGPKPKPYPSSYFTGPAAPIPYDA